MVACDSVICSTPGYSTMLRYRSSSSVRFGTKKGSPASSVRQMNISSVAKDTWLLPAETFAATALRIAAFGTEIRGFKSG